MWCSEWWYWDSHGLISVDFLGKSTGVATPSNCLLSRAVTTSHLSCRCHRKSAHVLPVSIFRWLPCHSDRECQSPCMCAGPPEPTLPRGLLGLMAHACPLPYSSHAGLLIVSKTFWALMPQVLAFALLSARNVHSSCFPSWLHPPPPSGPHRNVTLSGGLLQPLP